MDIIESIKKDKAYVKCKSIVKLWEKDFKVKYSRTPSKFDIKEAPSKIKYAYKKYFQLKSAALETSLSMCDIDEDMVLPEVSQGFENIMYETLSPKSEQLLESLPSAQELESLLSSTGQCLLPSPIKEPISVLSDNLSKKLFQNRKFSLRNPRKISITKTQSSSSNLTIVKDKENNEEGLQEKLTETIDNIQLSKSLDDTIAQKSYCEKGNSGNTLNLNISSVRQLDKAWLERATGVRINDVATSGSDSKDNLNTDKFGLRNVTIPKEKFDYIENSESEDDVAISKLKPALKKRKLNVDIQPVVTQKQHNETKEIVHKTTKEIQKTVKSLKPSGSKNSKLKSITLVKDDIKQLQPPNISEYVPYGLENDILPRFMHPLNSLIVERAVKEDTTNAMSNITERGKLENKIKNGTLNDNFVKINIEKKVFVRGKKNITFSKYKKQQWKDKKALHAGMEFPESGKILCFKCGQSGHMARYCASHKGGGLLPLESYNEDIIPTLEEMQNNFEKFYSNLSLPEQLKATVYKPSEIPASFLKLLDTSATNNDNDLKPIYSYGCKETPKEILDALYKFGHQSFRSGQEHAIMRILCGMSTLLILSTGGGKSLCYQLPAYIYSQKYKCVTLVISPLVSLMEDQVHNMPEFLKAGCLHTNQPPTQRRKIIQCIRDGEINILLISPEALMTVDTSNGFSGLFKSLPQIAFACIDEAHCVSQWSHNFRPSYLMICRILREKLNVKCILGLTATASQPTIKSIINHINVPDGMTGVITNPALPDNLHLSVSLEKDKDKALISYLTSNKIKIFESIIVYCIRRDECERVAAVLRSCLQENGKVNMEKQNKKRKRMSYIAEAYHAGMSAAQRKKIQKNFIDGTLRIIVATVAFGMGINKSNIRCIMHYNMPSSFESYVQEVGRAGRDAQPAFCHVLMSNNNNDKNELLRHIHANTIDRPTIRKLLQKVFIPCECVSSKQINGNTSLNQLHCQGHEVGIAIDTTVEELDIPSENIATLLCYIELHSKKYIKVLNNAYTMCKISSYGGPMNIHEAAKICHPLAMAYILESKRNPEILKNNIVEFNVIEVAAAIGWESGVTKYQLKNLEWTTENGVPKKSLLNVEFHTLGFRIKARGDLTPMELDDILDDLHQTVLAQEKTMLYQLEESANAFSRLGDYSLENCTHTENTIIQKSEELKSFIRNYFERETRFPSHISLEERPLDVERVKSDVRSLISSYKDCSFSGRSIARIFQGISSPNYQAIVWGRCKFWRSHIHEDFYGLMKIATQLIIEMKM